MKTRASDSWVAISVIACSLVLFVALALGLSSRFMVPGGNRVRVRFPDVTGIKDSSQVKYAGAAAGAVSAVRMLSAAERTADPGNLIEITMDLYPDVPCLSKNARVSIAADTLLSDKFVLIHDLVPAETRFPRDEVLQGTPPVTFDELIRNVDHALEGVRKILGGGLPESDILSRVHTLVAETQGLVTELKPVVADARVVITEAKATLTDARTVASSARSLLADNKEGIGRAVTKLDSAAGSIDSLAKKGEAIARDNEKNLSRIVSDLRVTSENFKVTSTYSKTLLRDLAERPSRLLWGGGKPPMLPSEQQILQSRQPVPAR